MCPPGSDHVVVLSKDINSYAEKYWLQPYLAFEYSPLTLTEIWILSYNTTVQRYFGYWLQTSDITQNPTLNVPLPDPAV